VQFRILWPALVAAVSGKSWEGKEKVLEAFVTFAVDTKAIVNSDAGKMKELEQIVLREAKRNNPTYRGPAIKCLGIYADGFETLDLFERTYDIVDSAVAPADENEMDVDGGEGRSEKQLLVISSPNFPSQGR
jgi:proteasome component ECM29